MFLAGAFVQALIRKLGATLNKTEGPMLRNTSVKIPSAFCPIGFLLAAIALSLSVQSAAAYVRARRRDTRQVLRYADERLHKRVP